MLSNLLYIDPAATTALISSLTAIVVALGATFIILWRKLKKGVKKTLHIDENANKDAEEDLIVLDENADENADESANESAEEVAAATDKTQEEESAEK